MSKRRVEPQPPPAPRRALPSWLLPVALFAGTFLLYVPSLFNGFVAVDDPYYITNRPIVQRGLTLEGFKWAFTTTEFANWLPVTWLSHMLDCQLFGLNPTGHHLTSALIHAANAALVFLLLKRLIGATGRSLAVALLFAAHPLRVESVAWLSERKDILCGLFFLLTLLAYTAYARRPRMVAYAAVVVLYALGLMSKTMIVTLPFLLLLLDAWPLGRLSRVNGGKLILEKLPLLALAVIASAWTVVQQGAGAALAPWAHLTLAQRLGNALVSVPRYLWKIVRPVDLSILYVHPGSWAGWKVIASATLVLAITAACIYFARRRPYLIVGWLWFCGMLVPVSGIVQAGDQAMADRYTYLPAIGLVMAGVWLVADLAETREKLRRAIVPAMAVLLVVLSVATIIQQGHWRDTESLAGHALKVDEGNWAAHGILATHRLAQRRHDEAITHFVRCSRGMRRVGRGREAVQLIEELVRRFPYRPDVQQELVELRRALPSTRPS